jgi:hypothetical protein
MESLTPKPGIREQHRPKADIGPIKIPQCGSPAYPTKYLRILCSSALN